MIISSEIPLRSTSIQTYLAGHWWTAKLALLNLLRGAMFPYRDSQSGWHNYNLSSDHLINVDRKKHFEEHRPSFKSTSLQQQYVKMSDSRKAANYFITDRQVPSGDFSLPLLLYHVMVSLL